MYFHCIPASVITSHGFTIILNLIITIALAYVLKMGHSVLRAALLDKHTPSLPHDKHCTEGFGFTNPGFSKRLWNLVWLCNNPFTN